MERHFTALDGLMEVLIPKESTAVSADEQSEDECIRQRLEEFRGVSNRYSSLVLKYFTKALLLGLILTLVLTGTAFIMYISMVAAVALTLIVFGSLMQSIPSALRSLWIRGIIVDRPLSDYCSYIKDFQDRLNYRPGQIAAAAVFAIIMFARSLYEFLTWLPHEFWTGPIYAAGGRTALLEGFKIHLMVYLVEYSAEEPLKFFAGIAFEPFLGLILGLVVWRMFVTGWYIGMLGNRFEIDPQMHHPDRAGGLEPLGHLSLLNALIISIWGVFLAGWIILGPSAGYGGFYTPVYQKMLIIPILIAISCFVLPLWRVHQIMVAKKDRAKRDLESFNLKIDRLKQEIISKTEGSSEGLPEGAIERLRFMQDTYEQAAYYPVWPFSQGILAQFIISQAVPILGLTGLGKAVINLLQVMVDFLSQFW